MALGRLLEHGSIEAVSVDAAKNSFRGPTLVRYSVPFEIHIRWRQYEYGIAARDAELSRLGPS
jgi:hypothetical protein